MLLTRDVSNSTQVECQKPYELSGHELVGLAVRPHFFTIRIYYKNRTEMNDNSSSQSSQLSSP
jgi:hypothetical protein